MPYRSESQRRWAHTATGKKALGGEAGVREWDEATKGKELPEKVEKSSSFKAEDFQNIKRPSIENLRIFLENNRLKRQPKK
ncbi:hypothetical protein CCP1ISM_130004 [Azospirillaceae bacterium]